MAIVRGVLRHLRWYRSCSLFHNRITLIYTTLICSTARLLITAFIPNRELIISRETGAARC